MLSPRQCRAARALLDWSQAKLAEEARVKWRTVHEFEKAASTPRQATIRSIAMALSQAGVTLLEREGVAPG